MADPVSSATRPTSISEQTSRTNSSDGIIRRVTGAAINALLGGGGADRASAQLSSTTSRLDKIESDAVKDK